MLGIIIFIPCLYLGLAYVLSRIGTEREATESTEVAIYILTNGVHTDLVLPLKNEQADWSEHIRFENTISKDTTAEFVAFGWGNKGFYLETPTWADLKFTTAFKAAFGLSTSAIHATFYKEMQEGEVCRKVMLSRSQYARLVQYVRDSFAMDSGGRAIFIKTTVNYGKDDAFYEAKGRYSLFHTCNTWANSGLKISGQKASLWTPFDTGIFYHYSD
ncbi:MAG TPA: TIGR02117 family protein [Patescibacteria group bacterium]|nr:TIGR02117 family protein [Patescibacteria group bacterium]